MPFADIYNSKPVRYEIGETAGVQFDSVEKFIPENQPITIESSDTYFISQSIFYYFNYENLIIHFKTNPINAYLEIMVRYSISSSDPSFFYEANLLVSFTYNNKVIDDLVIQAKNSVYTNANDGQEVESTFRIYSNTLPTESILTDPNFGISIAVSCKNSAAQILLLAISAIECNMYSSTAGSYIAILDVVNNKFIEETQDIFLGNVNANLISANSFRVYNFGSQNLLINENSISSDIDAVSLTPKIDKQIISIEYNKFVDVPFQYVGALQNESYQSTISMQTLANNAISQIYQITISFTTNITEYGKFALFYGDQNLSLDGILALPVVTQGLQNSINLVFKNVGTQNLTINNIVCNGSVYSLANTNLLYGDLQPNQEKTFVLGLNDAIVGNANGQITIYNSDFSNSVFIVKIFFMVKEAAKMELRDGISVDFTETSLNNNQIIDFGSLSRNRIIKRYYTISNSGVYSSIRIDSVQSTTVDARITELPTLPVFLEKNNQNALTFSVIFDTNDGVSKQADIDINYTVI